METIRLGKKGGWGGVDQNGPRLSGIVDKVVSARFKTVCAGSGSSALKQSQAGWSYTVDSCLPSLAGKSKKQGWSGFAWKTWLGSVKRGSEEREIKEEGLSTT